MEVVKFDSATEPDISVHVLNPTFSDGMWQCIFNLFSVIYDYDVSFCKEQTKTCVQSLGTQFFV